MSKGDKKKDRLVSDMSQSEIYKLLEEAGLNNHLKTQESLKELSESLAKSNRSKLETSQSGFTNLPKREIQLSTSEEKKVQAALYYFESNSLYEAELIKLFEDWQSSRTKSIKKFLLSILTVLSLTVFAGINILNVELFSITVAEGYEYLFLSCFLFVLGSLFYYYEVNLRRDKRVNDANLKVFMKALQRSKHHLEVVDNVLKDKGIGIEELINDFKESGVASLTASKKSPRRGYNLMKFYKTDLEAPFITDLKIYRFEITGLYAIGLLSMLTIFRSMLWVKNPDTNLVVFYLLGVGVIATILALLQLRFDD